MNSSIARSWMKLAKSRLIFFAVAVFIVCCSNIRGVADEETCAVCDLKILVTGQFKHQAVPKGFVITGASRRDEEGFRGAISGTNFTLSVPNLAAGKYTVQIGLVEADFNRPGCRIFTVNCGDQILADRLDLFVVAGGKGNVYFLTNQVNFPGEAAHGSFTLTFTGQTGAAELNTFELLDESGQSLVSMHAGDLINVEDAKAANIPVVTTPEIWKDASQPLDARVHDLVSRLSLAEKVQQMRNGAPPIPRLGIPAYNYWNECLHGVAAAGVATVFPQAIGMAATWDTSLIHQETEVISTEARAKYNDYASKHNGNSKGRYGLTFWSPNINIFRDPRWGRGQETYGEDPFLSGQLAVAFITGLQGDDPRYVKAMACAKHFDVHSGPESLRHTFDAEPSQRDFYETYLPAFEAAVREGHVGGVMGAYTALYGVPDCASQLLLTDILRKQWGFDGYVVSDCGAIYDIWANHKYVATPEEAAADAVKAGCDICCGGRGDYNALIGAVKKGLITELQINDALADVLKTRFRLGMFDPPEMVPWSKITIAQNDTPEHQALALKVAQESIVLLKNDGVLPLNRAKVKRIAIIGANADSVPMLVGNYNGTPSNPVTILDGIKRIAGAGIEVTFEVGCPLALERNDSNKPSSQMLDDAIESAKSADVVIYVGGISAQFEGEQMSRANQFIGFEGGDRTRIELPSVQEKLLKALYATGKPIIFINCSGSAMAMTWEATHLPAIIQAWYPGEQGGNAVADVVFGNVNPAGRLPVTFYRSTDDLPVLENYSMSNRTYRYFGGKPLFSFGHGLSYTKFSYTKVRLNDSHFNTNDTVKLSFVLKNSGNYDGDEVAQVYFRHIHSTLPQPKLSLCGFNRYHLSAGQAIEVTINVPAKQLRYWDTVKKQYVVELGNYELLVGAASDDIRLRVPLKIIEAR